MRKAVAAVTTLAAAAAFAAPASAGEAPGTIVDVAVNASGGGDPDSNHNDYDLLVQAVTATGLAPTLSDTSTKFTVFAPNDRAFIRLARTIDRDVHSEKDALAAITGKLSGDQIKNVLLYHVVAGKQLNLRKVQKSKRLKMANKGVVKPRGRTLKDETRKTKNPKVIKKAANIRASNGIIHTIDRVLMPRG